MNVLVTGHKGRLGQLVVTALQMRGHKVIGYDRGDDYPSLMEAPIDYIIHLAAQLPTGQTGMYEDMNAYLENNVYLSNLFLILAKEKQCPIFLASTYSIFFKLDKYAYSKAIVDSLAWEYKNMGVKVSVGHIPNVVYKDKNIFTQVEENIKTHDQWIVDSLDFNFVKAEELAVALALLPESGNVNFKMYTTNLYDNYKDNPKVKKGAEKSYVINDNGFIQFRYTQ